MNSFILIENENKIEKIAIDSIVFISLEDCITKLHFVNRDPLICFESLKCIMAKLNTGFFQINRQQIINIKYINAIEKQNRKIFLSNSNNLVVSYRKKKELIKLLYKFPQKLD